MEILSKITQILILPSLGIARVGNSPNEFFFGPEVPRQHVIDPGNFRDKMGRIKRQAARFRLYGMDANGNIVQELTAADGNIKWSVHVANKKSSWYDFDLAFDIPAAQGKIQGYPAVVSQLRNKTITERKRLAIDGGRIDICGVHTNKDGSEKQYAFDKGTFYNPSGSDTPVYLGELRTDAEGRLIFLGGLGHSSSYNNTPATTFANNETWHDDTSDGSVDAVITLNDGRTLTALGAWVLTAPPDYAPGLHASVTGYDLLLQTAIDAGFTTIPATPSFWKDIYPILKNISENQWVNKSVFIQNGWGSPSDFSSPELIRQLSDPSTDALPLRKSIFSQYRNPNYLVMQAEFLPAIYGDGVQSFSSDDTDPRNFMAILPYQYEYLHKWAAGDFLVDQRPGEIQWDDLTPAQQAACIDQGVLDETIGGPFHPGCEYTWPMRNTLMYSSAFRIKRRSDAPLDFGPTLDSQQALAPGGPLDGSSPGDITRWMAIPWQTDTSSCLSGYAPIMGLYTPTFWPVRVPNDVLPEDGYNVVINTQNTAENRILAFDNREKWLRGVVYKYGYPPRTVSPYTKGINDFIAQWSQLGIILEKDGPEDTNLFPASIWVETGRQLPEVAIAPQMHKEITKESDPFEPLMGSDYLWMVHRAKERKDGK